MKTFLSTTGMMFLMMIVLMGFSLLAEEVTRVHFDSKIVGVIFAGPAVTVH